MKLLLFSDLHGDTHAAQRLVERSQDVDVLVGAGDFGNARRDVDRCIHVLRAVSCPAVVVPGNNESFEELQAACSIWPQVHVLHGSGVTIQSIPFYGLGGSVPVTPFGAWSYDFPEDEARTLLQNCPQNAVLISHSPPKGLVDRSSSGQSLGSEAAREIIDLKQPRLIVCGHIHASAGQQAKQDNTVVINAGPQGTIIQV